MFDKLAFVTNMHKTFLGFNTAYKKLEKDITGTNTTRAQNWKQAD